MAKQRPKKRKPTKKARKARNEMQLTSTADIIQAMDYLLSVLKQRGVKIKNWDEHEQEIGMFRIFKSQPYYMVATEEQLEQE